MGDLFTICFGPNGPSVSNAESKLLKELLYYKWFYISCTQSTTWSLTLREERKLRVFENMVLRRIFGLRRDEVTGE